MIAEKHSNLAENLKSLCKARRLSLSEFSKELGTPKTTLQAILESGQTTLHTALRVSEKLSVPLDTLVNGRLSPAKINRMDGFMSRLEWYSELSREKREEAYRHINALIRLIQEGNDE